MRKVIHSNPGGFTLAELIIGLVVLAILAGATAAVATSVTRGWQVGESNQTSTLTISRTMLRIQDKLQRSRFMGQFYRGTLSTNSGTDPAAILFWREDDNGDGKMQLDETQLLEFDRANNDLVVWEVSFSSPTTRAAQNGPFPTTMLTDSNAITNYKALPYVKKYAITHKVLGAIFDVITPTNASVCLTFEYRLKFNGPNGESVEYGTATQRMPAPAS